MLTKPTRPFASDGEIASKMEQWGDALAARVAELEAALAKPAWERQFHWSDHVPGNCEVCNCDQDAEPCREHVCPGCAELMRGLEYAHDQIQAQRDRLREELERIEHKSQPMPREGHHFCPYRTALDAVNQSAKAALKEPA